MQFLVVPCLVNEGTTFPFAPSKFHPSAVESGLCASGYHCCFRDVNAVVQDEHLALLLFGRVYGDGEGSVDAGVEFGHVVVIFQLGDCCTCGVNVGDEVAEQDCIEPFSLQWDC